MVQKLVYLIDKITNIPVIHMELMFWYLIKVKILFYYMQFIQVNLYN